MGWAVPRGRFFAAIGAATLVSGCVTAAGSDIVRFKPTSAQQEVTVRDGDSLVTSRGKNSVVSLRSDSRLVGERPVFIVGIQNLSRGSLNFRMDDIHVRQIVDGKPSAQLKVYSYDELVAEEQVTQVGRRFASSIFAGFSDALTGNNAGGSQLMAQTYALGDQNLKALEELSLKDHTLMAGETYAGKLAVQSPSSDNASAQKVYSIALVVGPDRHDIQVVQQAAVK